MSVVNVAFEVPGNSSGSCPSRERPIDLVHLAQQTMGDKALEAEVLQMFARQARLCLNEIGSGDVSKAKAGVHRLKGAASSVGAFKVAQAAEDCETSGNEPSRVASVGLAVVEAENFILKLSR